MLFTQICPAMFGIPKKYKEFSGGKSSGAYDLNSAMGPGRNSYNDVTVYETTTKMGVTAELVSAINSDSFYKYLSDKGLNLPDKSSSILQEYVGRKYSFVVSWISDIETFRQQQETHGYYGERSFRNSIGVFVSFPTNKIYFPLKPTSVYEDKHVPVKILVMDYVTPKLYPGIIPAAEVDYYFGDNYICDNELKSFFFGKRKVKNLRYTRITIDVASKYFTDDLWIEKATPFKVAISDFICRYQIIAYLILASIASILASLIAYIIIYKHPKQNIRKFTLAGLLNIFTIIPLGIAACFLKTKQVFKDVKNYISEKRETIFEQRNIRYIIKFACLPIFILILSALLPSVVDTVVQKTLSSAGYYYSYYSNRSYWMLAFLSLILIVSPFVFAYFWGSEKVKQQHAKFIPNDIKILNLKKFLFLFFVNMVAPVLIFILYSALYDKLGNNANELLILALFIITFVIIYVISGLHTVFYKKRKRCKHSSTIKGLYIYHKDNRKLLFIPLFSVLFICIAFISKLLLSAIISIPGV